MEKIREEDLKQKINKENNRINDATISGIPVKIIYVPDDIKDLNYDRDLGMPGQYPYTRGVRQTMYRGRLWTMRQFSGFGTAKDTNKRYKFLLAHGETGLSVAFDFPTLYGRDSDEEISAGEVGKCGVAISSLADMETLFDGIPMAEVSTSMTINGPASVIWAFYIAAAEKQGVKSKQLRGTIQNDILKEYIAQKSWLFPPKPSMRIITDIMEFAAQHVPQWNTISISGYHIREAGSTAVQELAFTLKDGLTYVEEGIKAGLDVDVFAPRLSYFFNSHLDFFEEIAKYRAARRIWAREMKNTYKAKKPESLLLRFHTQTAGCTLTAQQPENNIVRTAFQGLAAVLGGTQSLHTNSMDETWALPTEKAVLIALRTQQLIAYETGVANVIDPLGGSYYVESLTNKMEQEAYNYFKKIDKMGGMIKAIENGYPQREIANAAYNYQKQVEQKKRTFVGVNDFILADEKLEMPILKIDHRVSEEQNKRIQTLRKKRNNAQVAKVLKELKRVCQTKENVMYPILKAVKAYATLGEICAAMKEIFGVYKEPPMF
ncbi:MAG: methylmalonyl-CoA mutase family protein [Candidatus Latescibacteria bacterium]|nr:methylmalonyl-CoA mutase family protein [Candidatus Latescibacterota bacterium]